MTGCSHRCGDVVRLNIPGPSSIYPISDPHYIKQILLKESRNIVKDRRGVASVLGVS